MARVAAGPVSQPAALRAGREGAVGGEAPARRGDPHARLAAPDQRVRRELHVSARPHPGGARARGRPRLPRCEPRRPRAAPAHEAPPALPAAARGRPPARVGSQDDSRGRLLRAAGAPERRRRPLRRRHRRVRGRALAQGDPLRDAVGDVRRARRVRRAQGRRRLAPVARGVRPHGGRELHRGRHARHPEHAPGVQGRALRRRREGGADDADRRPLPRWADRDG